jgi:hypothetical protein
MNKAGKWIWVILFAIAMGYLETSVVIYLRTIYYPEGFVFPLKVMNQTLAVTEIFREAATIIMITAIGFLASKQRLQKFAWFLMVFGIWDINYYIFLKLLIGWPDSFMTYDILFLIPSIWTGPVLAPVINSFIMIVLATIILFDKNGVQPLTRLPAIVWLLLIGGSIIILLAYMKEYVIFIIEYTRPLSRQISLHEYSSELPSKFIPRSFDWLLFLSGIMMHIVAIVLMMVRKRKIHLRLTN